MKSFNYENLNYNANALYEYNNKKLIAVVKNDGYGCGLLNVIDTLHENNNVDMFMVTTINEALIINNKYSDVNVLISNPLTSEDLNNLTISNNIHLIIDSYDYLHQNINTLKNFNLHLKINSSMNRFGVDCIEEAIKCIELCKDHNINLIGICTHVSIEDEDENKYNNLIDKFLEIYNFVNNQFNLKYIHVENSFTYLRKDSRLDMCTHCRIGLLLYGYNYTENNLYLKPLLTFSTKVIKIRDLKKGETISYGINNVLDKDTKIAICDVGYGNGLLRSRNKFPVKINNNFYNVFGVISMSHMYVEVDSNVKVGDEVFLYDEDKLSVVMHHTEEQVAASIVLSYLN